MATIKLDHWQTLEVDKRQRTVLEFYATNDINLRKSFLSFVRAPRGHGVFASAGPNYSYAIFGRDSLEVAEDLLRTDQQLAREIILLLASLQGVQYTHTNEEEPGKIHHEYRSRHFNGRTIPKAAEIVFDRLSHTWGGDDNQMLYFGTYDASALFIRLIHAYCKEYGNDILQRSVKGMTIGQRVRQTALWIAGRVSASPWYLFEFKRLNQSGIYNQAWEDSDMAYLHTDGKTAFADGGLAPIELQGYAYDALSFAADMVAYSVQEAAAWRELANTIQSQTLKLLWMEKENYFAMGMDRDPATNTGRQIATINLNPALLLNTKLLSDLPDDQEQRYVEHIARTIFSEEFATPAGLRLRAKKHAGLLPYADYHGSLVSWPKQTYDVARGLRAHGLPHLATFLEDCILHAIAEAGEFYEFFFVNGDDRPKYHYRVEYPDEPTGHEFGAANMPDPGQAWTISAVMAIIANRHRHVNTKSRLPKPTDFETSLLNQPHLKTIAEITTTKDAFVLESEA